MSGKVLWNTNVNSESQQKRLERDIIWSRNGILVHFVLKSTCLGCRTDACFFLNSNEDEKLICRQRHFYFPCPPRRFDWNVLYLIMARWSLPSFLVVLAFLLVGVSTIEVGDLTPTQIEEKRQANLNCSTCTTPFQSILWTNLFSPFAFHLLLGKKSSHKEDISRKELK